MTREHSVPLPGLVPNEIGSLGTLTWLEEGQGQPLILLHGIGSDAGSWGSQFTAFSATRRVLAWNAPGYATSSPLEGGPKNPTRYAELLAESLNALNVGTCAIVGHSLGALTAARFMRLYPDRVSALLLSSPASGYGQEEQDDLLPALKERLTDVETLGPAGMAAKRAARTLSPGAGPDLVHQAAEAMARVSITGYRDAVTLLSRGSLSADLSALPRDKIRLITAEHDQIIKPERVHALAEERHLPSPTVIAHAGHASYLENPSGFTAAIEACLASVAASDEA
ncbi:alpha/beta fold hydrolase [Asaia astilbis]